MIAARARLRPMLARHARAMSSYVSVPFFHVDSFSKTPYGGNPAAVVLLPAALPALDDATMAKVAAENNLSETCFVVPLSASPSADFGAGAEFHLRWFTPKKEVALCGHGTLAVATALFSKSVGNPNACLTFHTLSGALTAARTGEGGALIELNFPMNTPRVVRAGDAAPEAVAKEEDAEWRPKEALHATCLRVARLVLRLAGGGDTLEIDTLAHDANTRKLIVHTRAVEPSNSGGSGSKGGVSPKGAAARAERAARDLAALVALKVPSPDAVLEGHAGEVVTGVSIVVAGASGGGGGGEGDEVVGGYDFASRYFSPWNGIPEDPVNGSSHTVLSPYWYSHVLGLDEGIAPAEAAAAEAAAGDAPASAKASARALRAWQASPRGGELVLGNDFGAKRVRIAGPAVVVIEGTMLIPGPPTS